MPIDLEKLMAGIDEEPQNFDANSRFYERDITPEELYGAFRRGLPRGIDIAGEAGEDIGDSLEGMVGSRMGFGHYDPETMRANAQALNQLARTNPGEYLKTMADLVMGVESRAMPTLTAATIGGPAAKMLLSKLGGGGGMAGAFGVPAAVYAYEGVKKGQQQVQDAEQGSAPNAANAAAAETSGESYGPKLPAVSKADIADPRKVIQLLKGQQLEGDVGGGAISKYQHSDAYARTLDESMASDDMKVFAEARKSAALEFKPLLANAAKAIDDAGTAEKKAAAEKEYSKLRGQLEQHSLRLALQQLPEHRRQRLLKQLGVTETDDSAAGIPEPQKTNQAPTKDAELESQFSSDVLKVLLIGGAAAAVAYLTKKGVSPKAAKAAIEKVATGGGSATAGAVKLKAADLKEWAKASQVNLKKPPPAASEESLRRNFEKLVATTPRRSGGGDFPEELFAERVSSLRKVAEKRPEQWPIATRPTSERAGEPSDALRQFVQMVINGRPGASRYDPGRRPSEALSGGDLLENLSLSDLRTAALNLARFSR